MARQAPSRAAFPARGGSAFFVRHHYTLMTRAQLVLEFLKVLLSPQVIAGVVACSFLLFFRDDIKALLLRIAKIKFPGGAELSTPQTAKLEEAFENKPPPTPPPTEDSKLPANLAPPQLQAVRDLLDAERARAYLWEYRYLNYFLVYQTQHILDWFASLPTRTSLQLFDTMWLPFIPSADGRRAIINALQAHHLIIILEGDLVEVTPKGREYIQWRGPLPQPKA